MGIYMYYIDIMRVLPTIVGKAQFQAEGFRPTILHSMSGKKEWEREERIGEKVASLKL